LSRARDLPNIATIMAPAEGPITEMNHFTVLADDLDRTRAFYELLGLREGERPPLGFPGAWLYAAGRPVLHVIARQPLPAERRGVLDHMAFSARGLAALVDRLRQAGTAHEVRRQAGSGVWQLFLFDPNGARVELDFDPAEPPPGP
jgi:catechol 2,3-dioxygenase-like lactoylglutathione lyase family enzyme